MSKTPIKLKLFARQPGSMSLAEQRGRFLEATREQGFRLMDAGWEIEFTRYSNGNAVVAPRSGTRLYQIAKRPRSLSWP